LILPSLGLLIDKRLVISILSFRDGSHVRPMTRLINLGQPVPQRAPGNAWRHLGLTQSRVGLWWTEAREATERPTGHRMTPQHQATWSSMSVVQRWPTLRWRSLVDSFIQLVFTEHLWVPDVGEVGVDEGKGRRGLSTPYRREGRGQPHGGHLGTISASSEASDCGKLICYYFWTR
jgi:hypothetical protein